MNAADVRTDSKTRAKCHQMLSNMKPSAIVSIGLASDYMQESMSFLRKFERDIDFSQVPEFIKDFEQRMSALFLQCKVLNEVDGDDVVQTGAVIQICFTTIRIITQY